MFKTKEFGCKKCGGVVKVDIQPWTDRADVKVKEGKVKEKFGAIEIHCRKCNKAVATIAVDAV